MKFIKELKEGDRVFDIYLCKHKQEAVTKNGKPYESVILQDKTGTIDAKVWEPNNPGIGDYDDLDYIEVYGDVTNFQGQLQISVKRIRVCREGEYNPSDYEDDSDIDDLDEILNDYVTGAEETAAAMNVFFLNTNEALQWNPQNAACYLVDAVHPNEEGRFLFGTAIIKALEEDIFSYPVH